MRKRRVVLLGSTLLLLVITALLFYRYSNQTKEIRICFAIKDFYDQNQRAPLAFNELPEKVQTWAHQSPNGKPYQLSCSGQTPPECSIHWEGGEQPRKDAEEQTNHASSGTRSCGPLNTRGWSDWF